MNLPGRILAIVNPSAESQPALDRAVSLATATKAELLVQAIVYAPEAAYNVFFWQDGENAAARDERVAEVQSWVENLTAGLDRLPLSTGATWGHPFDQAVLAVVAGHQPDLVVCQPRDPSGQRLNLTEWRLLSRCPAPLWLARTDAWSQRPRVMAAVDPDHANDKPAALDRTIIAAAATLGQALEADVSILHAMGEIPSAIGIAQPPQEYERELRASREERIRKLIPESLAGRCTVQVAARPPLGAMRDYCTANRIDLVVMGMLARSRIKDLLVGSTAREFIPRSCCDVLLIKPDDS